MLKTTAMYKLHLPDVTFGSVSFFLAADWTVLVINSARALRNPAVNNTTTLGETNGFSTLNVVIVYWEIPFDYT